MELGRGSSGSVSIPSRSPNRRTALRAALGWAAVVWLTACTKAPAPPLRVATIPWPGYESIHLAQSLGHLDAGQVRLVELVSASQTSKSLRSGAVDAALLTLDETLSLMQEGADLRVVLLMDVSDGADVVLARPGIGTLQELRGKRIGAETGAIGAVMLDAMLTASGLTVADLQVIDMPVNEHENAFVKGRVDAIVTFEPARTKLLGQGAKVLFDSSRIPGRIIDVLAVRAEALDAHPRALNTLVAAHFKALDHLARQPQDAAVRLAPYLRVTPEQVLAQFVGIKLPGLAENREQLSGPVPPLQRKAGELAELMLRQGLLQAPVAVAGLAEPRFLPPAAP
jgi:NitT/TauT family transport system substrate-binding protein